MPSDLNRLEMDLRTAGLRAASRAAAVIRKNGQDVVRDAQAMCPVDTGALKSSISVDYTTTGLGYEAGPTVDYGGYVELGTSRMAPRAYLGPAFDRNLPGVIGALEALGGSVL